LGKENRMKLATKSWMFAAGALFALTAPLALASAQAADPAIGTWVLNVAKSKYGGTAPKSATRTYTAVGKGYKFSSTVVDAAGKSTTTEFTVAFDGKPSPMTGSPTADAILVKRIDANSTESTLTKAGKVVSNNTRTISKDGKTMTSTAKSTDASGKTVTNFEVYEKK
jgi:hypothetical protein